MGQGGPEGLKNEKQGTRWPEWGGGNGRDSHLEVERVDINQKSWSQHSLKIKQKKSLPSQRKTQICKENRLNTFQELLMQGK